MPDRHAFRVTWDARIPTRDGIELSANNVSDQEATRRSSPPTISDLMPNDTHGRAKTLCSRPDREVNGTFEDRPLRQTG